MFEVGAIEAGQYYSEERRLLLLQDSLVNRLKVTTVTIRPNFRQDLNNRSATLKMRLSLSSIRWIININSKKNYRKLDNSWVIQRWACHGTDPEILSQSLQNFGPMRRLWDYWELEAHGTVPGFRNFFSMIHSWKTRPRDFWPMGLEIPESVSLDSKSHGIPVSLPISGVKSHIYQ